MTKCFIIVRTPKDVFTTNECVSYFSGFQYAYDVKNDSEEYGLENWNCDIFKAEKFSTCLECFEWFKTLKIDTDKYIYEIVLHRESREEDNRDDHPTYVPLKSFFTSGINERIQTIR